MYGSLLVLGNIDLSGNCSDNRLGFVDHNLCPVLVSSKPLFCLFVGNRLQVPVGCTCAPCPTNDITAYAATAAVAGAVKHSVAALTGCAGITDTDYLVSVNVCVRNDVECKDAVRSLDELNLCRLGDITECVAVLHVDYLVDIVGVGTRIDAVCCISLELALLYTEQEGSLLLVSLPGGFVGVVVDRLDNRTCYLLLVWVALSNRFNCTCLNLLGMLLVPGISLFLGVIVNHGVCALEVQRTYDHVVAGSNCQLLCCCSLGIAGTLCCGQSLLGSLYLLQCVLGLNLVLYPVVQDFLSCIVCSSILICKCFVVLATLCTYVLGKPSLARLLGIELGASVSNFLQCLDSLDTRVNILALDSAVDTELAHMPVTAIQVCGLLKEADGIVAHLSNYI